MEKEQKEKTAVIRDFKRMIPYEEFHLKGKIARKEANCKDIQRREKLAQMVRTEIYHTKAYGSSISIREAARRVCKKIESKGKVSTKTLERHYRKSYGNVKKM